jgi:hypothetical protein
MGPTFNGSAEIDADDFAEYTGVDTFSKVRWKCHVHYSLRCDIHCSVIRQPNVLLDRACDTRESDCVTKYKDQKSCITDV